MWVGIATFSCDGFAFFTHRRLAWFWSWRLHVTNIQHGPAYFYLYLSLQWLGPKKFIPRVMPIVELNWAKSLSLEVHFSTFSLLSSLWVMKGNLHMEKMLWRWIGDGAFVDSIDTYIVYTLSKISISIPWFILIGLGFVCSKYWRSRGKRISFVVSNLDILFWDNMMFIRGSCHSSRSLASPFAFVVLLLKFFCVS